ncbi:unnamed protein product [Allacma fusca]|uniref:Chitin-binding type-2 domain-containing protein n=1 Tax=Allacma fusca TaxID=39272 RepID=A0A8J2NKP3_9HEXA|nr:unnamed protein product [Allacma fusca]
MSRLYVAVALALFAAVVTGFPNVRVARQAEDEQYEEQPLGLPSNSTSLRANIVDTFSCQGKTYGYYADVDNDCQIFHICLPATFPDGTEKMFKWSFICPEETIFNQESFTCARADDAVPCAMAPQFYNLNDNFGVIPEKLDNQQ